MPRKTQSNSIKSSFIINEICGSIILLIHFLTSFQEYVRLKQDCNKIS